MTPDSVEEIFFRFFAHRIWTQHLKQPPKPEFQLAKGIRSEIHWAIGSVTPDSVDKRFWGKVGLEVRALLILDLLRY